MNRYLFDYRFDNSEWALEIVAANADEARERIKAISWATYKGEVAAVIPVSPSGIWRRLSSLIRGR